MMWKLDCCELDVLEEGECAAGYRKCVRNLSGNNRKQMLSGNMETYELLKN